MREIPFIETVDLTRSFGRTLALHRVSTCLWSGEVSLVMGPNGAGKSTLLAILATLDRPTSGRVRYGGEVDEGWMMRQGRGLIGWMGHESMLYGDLTGWENLVFFARLYGIGEVERCVGRCLEEVGLDREEHSRRPVYSYSRGMRQRLSLARAVVHDPSVLILDEPFTGLDLAGCQLVVGMMEKVKKRGGLVVLATHYLDLPEGLVDRVLVLRGGRLLYQGEVKRPLGEMVRRAQDGGEL
ncbi:MAG: heme ABC exporter ATP-binding protein CcmA [Bradymonadales bacterium]|nr:heme ABC exporter ATP-binding protein CcmA [Bradymonadales bacterium]